MLRTPTLLRIALVCLLPLWAAWAEDSSVNPPQANQDSAALAGTVPRLVSFSGAVKDAAGKPLTGPVDIHFAIYENFDGVEPLWFETQTVEVDAQGRFTALPGAMQPEGLPLAFFTTGKARWLEVMVVGCATMPRVLLVSVPYAFKAGDADTLGGKPATEYVASDQLKDQVQSEVKEQLANPTIGLRSLEAMVTNPSSTPRAITEGPSTFTCATSGTCVGVTQSGTGTPLLATSTATSAAVAALRGEASSTAGSGVFGWAKATSGTAIGVKGQTDSTGGIAIYGLATAATGTTFGVRGDVSSPSGRGVYGNATSGTGVTYGLLGIAASTSGVGLSGQATAVTGSTIGVRAVNSSPAGTAAIFDALGGGKIILGRTTGFVEKFSVDGSGNVAASGGVTASSFTGSGSSLTNLSASNLSGTVPNSAISGTYSNPVTFSNGTFAGAFGGSWSGPFSTYVLTGSAITGNSGYGYGIYGISSSGNGIYGGSSSGTAINGVSTSGNGVVGTTSSSSYPAVAGLGPSGGRGVTGLAGLTSTTYSNAAGVYGEGSTSANGVLGVSSGTGYFGVWGIASYGSGLSGKNNNSTYATLLLNNNTLFYHGQLLNASAPNYSIYAACIMYVNGDLACSGSKSAVVPIAGGRQVALYAVEAPENWFEDFGSGKLESGAATINVDPTFLQTVNAEKDYHVFVTPRGDCNGLYVARTTPTSFEVRELGGGRSSVGFDYRMVARRRGYETTRLADMTERFRRQEAKSPAANLESPSQR